MFEITYNGGGMLDDFIYVDKAYPWATYDFTFEGRFIVYHFFVKNTVRYVALDIMTGYGSEITRRKDNRLYDRRSYKSMIPLILDSIKYTGDKRYLDVIVSRPLETIDTIFRVILPEYGYSVREEQIKLCRDMYTGLTEKQVAICEAEVGTGKTLAYLIASFVAKQRYASEYGFDVPVTITTSGIELQKTIVEREIPRLSRMLQDYALIDHPLSAVVRKGKEHYFCKARYSDFLDAIRNNREKYGKLIDFFEAGRIEDSALDLDQWDIPASLKKRICVKGRCGQCGFKDECRYASFLKSACKSDTVDFQVTNHNLFLTDIRTTAEDPSCRLLLNSPYVVIDEAHKLLETAQETFGEQFPGDTIQKYINSVRYLKSDIISDDAYDSLLKEAAEVNRELFDILRMQISADESDDGQSGIITIPDYGVSLITKLKGTVTRIEAARKKQHGPYEMDGEKIIKTLNTFIRQNDINIWLESEDDGTVSLCCCPKNMADIMEKTVWNRSASYILTSGTMSDGTDFSYFKKENGIARLPKYLVSECSVPSPFDYANHTRMYIPGDMPVPDNSSEKYIDAVTERIIRLIEATNGHTAILFTSYKVLQAVYERAVGRLDKYDVFRMTRSSRKVISDFRRSENGVLFASGSMWEGVDCAGDCLSSLIIVRLPFPVRSAEMQQKKDEIGDVGKFILECAVPEMLIKLRQGAGRLIRCETDTGVISILDSRAAEGRYVPMVKTALHKYPTVDSVDEVKAFMESVKGADYYDRT